MAQYQTTGYTNCREILDSLARLSQTIDTQAKQLSDKERLIGSPSDSPAFRNSLANDEKRLHDTVQQTTTLFKKLTTEVGSRRSDLSQEEKIQMTQVQKAMEQALKKYQQILKTLNEKRQQFQAAKQDTLIDFEQDNTDDVNKRLQMRSQMQVQKDRLRDQVEQQYVIEEAVENVQ
ncbi:unnamed protein product, partial [Didymodactylos carnosus]